MLRAGVGKRNEMFPGRRCARGCFGNSLVRSVARGKWWFVCLTRRATCAPSSVDGSGNCAGDSLIPIILRLKRPGLWDSQILRLLSGHLSQLNAKLL